MVGAHTSGAKVYLGGWLIVVALHSIAVAVAGDLEPPGPPGPTMKTLNEVEPRTAIYADAMPLTISAGGSYYLAENITTAGAGIVITADSVTLDLNGFTLTGGSSHGIYVASSAKNITIENGTVAGWPGHGVVSDAFAENVLVHRVRADANGLAGISVGGSGTVIECTASGNGSSGFSNSNGNSTISGSTASGNVGSGISGGWSAITNCTAVNNGGGGITTTLPTLITSCVAYSNALAGISAAARSVVTNCRASGNGGVGIYGGRGATIRGCQSTNNTGDGIGVDFESLVADNTSNENGVGAAVGAGIRTSLVGGGGGNRIENNHVIGNDRGIDVDAAGNTIYRNTAKGNTILNYDIVAGNDIGPIGTAAAAVSPWANIAF
jgi:parallel beta-helix repeat protein